MKNVLFQLKDLNDNNQSQQQPIDPSNINIEEVYEEFIALYSDSNIFDPEYLCKMDQYFLGDEEPNKVFLKRFAIMVNKKLDIEKVVAVLKHYIK